MSSWCDDTGGHRALRATAGSGDLTRGALTVRSVTDG
jgi:hypothetical protein